jgi:hypothetical protein
MSLTTIPHDDENQTLSNVIESLGHGDDPQLSVAELVQAFGERAFGALILILALMSLFPWPPGGKAVFSAPIILLSLELALRQDKVWLPRWLHKASVSRTAYSNLISKPFAAPTWLRRWVLTRSFRVGFGNTRRQYVFSDWVRRVVRRRPNGLNAVRLLRRMERLSRPRIPVLTGEIADVIVGIVCVFLAVMLALPVPLGDMLPAITLVIFGLALTQRDGLAIIAGAIGTVLCAVYLVLVWATVVEIGGRIIEWLGGLF